MEFKQLELEPESNWFKRIIRSKHTKKSIIYIAIGALAGFLYFFLTEGKNMDTIQTSVMSILN